MKALLLTLAFLSSACVTINVAPSPVAPMCVRTYTDALAYACGADERTEQDGRCWTADNDYRGAGCYIATR